MFSSTCSTCFFQKSLTAFEFEPDSKCIIAKPSAADDPKGPHNHLTQQSDPMNSRHLQTHLLFSVETLGGIFHFVEHETNPLIRTALGIASGDSGDKWRQVEPGWPVDHLWSLCSLPPPRCKRLRSSILYITIRLYSPVKSSFFTKELSNRISCICVDARPCCISSRGSDSKNVLLIKMQLGITWGTTFYHLKPIFQGIQMHSKNTSK